MNLFNKICVIFAMTFIGCGQPVVDGDESGEANEQPEIELSEFYLVDGPYPIDNLFTYTVQDFVETYRDPESGFYYSLMAQFDGEFAEGMKEVEALLEGLEGETSMKMYYANPELEWVGPKMMPSEEYGITMKGFCYSDGRSILAGVNEGGRPFREVYTDDRKNIFVVKFFSGRGVLVGRLQISSVGNEDQVKAEFKGEEVSYSDYRRLIRSAEKTAFEAYEAEMSSHRDEVSSPRGKVKVGDVFYEE